MTTATMRAARFSRAGRRLAVEHVPVPRPGRVRGVERLRTSDTP
ncbi:hypothetical protein [Streptomyces cyslabdanicus]